MKAFVRSSNIPLTVTTNLNSSKSPKSKFKIRLHKRIDKGESKIEISRENMNESVLLKLPSMA